MGLGAPHLGSSLIRSKELVWLEMVEPPHTAYKSMLKKLKFKTTYSNIIINRFG